MTILLILSVCFNVYLLMLHRQQANALNSLREISGNDFTTIRRLKAESEAQAKKFRSNQADEPKKASVIMS